MSVFSKLVQYKCNYQNVLQNWNFLLSPISIHFEFVVLHNIEEFQYYTNVIMHTLFFCEMLYN